MSAAIASPGNPTIRNTVCHGRMLPITGRVHDCSAETSPTIQPPMKYASPDPRKTPIE